MYIYIYIYIYIFEPSIFFWWTLRQSSFTSKRCPLFTRWCRQVCTVQVGETAIPLKVSTKSGDEVNVEACPTSILWPWDILHWMWKKGTFFGWVADEQNTASARCEDYWNHCTHLDFYARLQLEANQHRTTVPVFFHADGVRTYKAQKAWIYSFSSACRKGPSTKNKTCAVGNRVIKDKTHDAIGKLMGYITSTMQSGQFPDRQPDGSPFAEGSLEASPCWNVLLWGVDSGFCSLQRWLGGESCHSQT